MRVQQGPDAARRRAKWRDPAARAAISARYAKMAASGKPEECPVGGGTVIFPDVAAAMSAAEEISDIGGPVMRSYWCHRARNTHAHLTGSPKVPRSR